MVTVNFNLLACNFIIYGSVLPIFQPIVYLFYPPFGSSIIDLVVQLLESSQIIFGETQYVRLFQGPKRHAACL